MEKATILIPDISGYTHFLTKTELSHSTHIINELLQVIADTIQPKFTLAEIEGDALLTYAKGKVDQKELEELCSEAFKNFHYYLKVIERDSVCRCGACNLSSQLTLKFIVHYGTFDEVKIAQFTKLSGPDMIIAHRLMKNSVPSSEYILLTDSYFEVENESLFSWKAGIDHYEILGEVGYRFADLAHLVKDVPNPEIQEDFSSLFGIAKEVKVTIDAPLKLVHDCLTDHSHKEKYIQGLNHIELDASINRVGSTHVCEFDGDSFDIKTLQDVGSNNNVIYIEKAHSIKNGYSMLAYYELKELGDNTDVSFRALTGDKQPIPQEMEGMVYDQALFGLNSLKQYIESQVLVTQ